MNMKQAGGNGPHQLQIALGSLKNVVWKDKRILDIGCGNGYITNEILKLTQAKEIIGIEIDSSRVLNANQFKNKLQENKLSFIKADVTDLSQFSDNSFDGVFSNMTFQQIPIEKLPTALKEVKRILKSDAIAIINFNQEKSEVTLEIQRLLLNKEDILKSKKINSETFKQYALDVGFREVRCVAQSDIYYHKTLDDLIGNPKKLSWEVKGTQLDNEQIKDIWQKIRSIFIKKETSLGYKESWNIVFAQLRK